MEKFPRGTLPPASYVEIARGAPTNTPGESPRGTCDLASTCPNCNTLMQPEHAHYRCATCGYRDSCCF
jgi:hypothetical protein